MTVQVQVSVDVYSNKRERERERERAKRGDLNHLSVQSVFASQQSPCAVLVVKFDLNANKWWMTNTSRKNGPLRGSFSMFVAGRSPVSCAFWGKLPPSKMDGQILKNWLESEKLACQNVIENAMLSPHRFSTLKYTEMVESVTRRGPASSGCFLS